MDVIERYKGFMADGMSPERAVMHVFRNYLVVPTFDLLKDLDSGTRWTESPISQNRCGADEANFGLAREYALPQTAPRKRSFLDRFNFWSLPELTTKLTVCEFVMLTPQAKVIDKINPAKASVLGDNDVIQFQITQDIVDHFKERESGKLFIQELLVYASAPLHSTVEKLYPGLPEKTFLALMNNAVIPGISGEPLNEGVLPVLRTLMVTHGSFPNTEVPKNNI